MFIEKPIFDGGDYRISGLNLNPAGIHYVAGPLRFSGVIRTLKEIAAEEAVYSARAICSSYLPDWRPETDYRKSYSARKDLGGGAALDLIHEWDYIVLLFGLPKRVYRIGGKYSHLEIDSDDTALYIADYGNMAVELHLDYYGRVPRREIELFTKGGTITGDLINHTVSFSGSFSDAGTSLCFREKSDELYEKEMNYFLDHVLANDPLSNMEECRSILNLALGKEFQ
ncbi:hypothetical protein SDC9_150936 [bioreactor metagenome]|uniref:GFO/IDH/MocA-like oxidoreductase domain-containing protein n=1 Tax=bioreactor metagenome TaxID=1076179 RepID=A0A645ET77_9ZZZZ